MKTCYLILLGSFMQLISATIVDDVEGLVEDFWKLANPIGSISVDSIELSNFMRKYDENSQPGDSLQITESHFISGTNTWTNDFSTRGITTHYSRAYYRSLDVFNFGAPYVRYMTFEDMDSIIDLIHFYIYGSTDDSGFLSENEFRQGFSELIFRNLPFGLMFVDFIGATPAPGFLEELPPDKFHDIFDVVDSDDDDKITDSELGVFWEERFYGASETGSQLFTRLDLDSDSFITRQDWTDLFSSLDCRPGSRHNNTLDLREFYQLDLILHDVIQHPGNSGNCTLVSVPGFKRLRYNHLM